mmetsp:Transcript_51480/g.95272  ORF Transcript_51480/g.95272 Transcript_51480/m.95272 type:complete len:219 (-) Transcript_51480:634-1290(-)|eukprot:CAMPEP_0197457902 /NCGR_PEP_ID=MMETSP1175-20131217/47347_1 /TAXON_ID=1003142 /ORGANISM="Triceratium dubium, Strain CCMP147" /LENGTH=218 /DNA_ID=CAMNT_0042992393 /DNA_START=253 /DNA_END=909 /DNA_ORIENTATION=+
MADYKVSCRVGLMVILIITAWSLSLAMRADCSFVKRVVTLQVDLNGTGMLPDMPGSGDTMAELAFSNSGLGFDEWFLRDRCYDYCMRGMCPSFDNNFNTAKAMCTAVNVLAGIGIITLLWQLWFSTRSVKYTDFAIFFLICCLFQGLTLLILRSDLCNDLDFFEYIEIILNVTNSIEVTNVTCLLNRGSRMAIVATAFWFVAAVIAMIEGDPDEDVED